MTSNVYPATLEALRGLSDADLMRLYDSEASITRWPRSEILDEIHRRESGRLNKQMVALTWAIFFLTLVVTVATVVNVAILFR